MGKWTATRLFNEALRLREASGAEEAYLFVREHTEADRLSGQADARQMNLLYALAAAAGREDEAFALLREAVQERGFWYPADYLLEDDDLDTLRGREGFAELADLSGRREEAALAGEAPALTVLYPEAPASSAAPKPEADTIAAADRDEEACGPLLLVLHGDQENEGDAEPFWRAALAAGWTVGLVRSSQIRFSDTFGWDDIDLGAAELREHLLALRGEASGGGAAPVVLGAFSAGAEVALNALLHDEFPADGLVLVSPWLDEPGEWIGALDRLEERTPRSVLIAGEADEEGRESAEAMSQAMQEAGLECRLEIVPGMEHDYPEDFAERLPIALAWISRA
ncbi:alpha/beta hydrolase [Saccharibacillus qingshengii]|uniref:alpha/beta hydrolase n=1 Tax=Saccharibacillus qingshengii TaxID=1763540 RepID=UPI001554CC83|nr:alpha/beta hydrolase [Saccharibacillus qingshengii]